MREKSWELMAPLGEFPDREALREVATELEILERSYRARKLLGGPDARPQDYLSLLVELLEEVMELDGVLTAQKDGGGAEGSSLKRCRSRRNPPSTSILAAMGVHGESSAYLILYWRRNLEREGKPPDIRQHLWVALQRQPTLWRQLGPIQARLFQRHPALRRGAQNVPPDTAPAFAGAVRRGDVIFPLSSWGTAAHLIVGKALVYACCVGAERLREAKDEDLAEELAEKITSQVLSAETILGLLRGEADVEEVERILILHQLADF
jgi:hypothetical protein